MNINKRIKKQKKLVITCNYYFNNKEMKFNN